MEVKKTKPILIISHKFSKLCNYWGANCEKYRTESLVQYLLLWESVNRYSFYLIIVCSFAVVFSSNLGNANGRFIARTPNILELEGLHCLYLFVFIFQMGILIDPKKLSNLKKFTILRKYGIKEIMQLQIVRFCFYQDLVIFLFELSSGGYKIRSSGHLKESCFGFFFLIFIVCFIYNKQQRIESQRFTYS